MRNLTVWFSWTSQTGNGRSCQWKTDLASQPSHDCTVGLLPFVSELWGQSTIHHCGCPAKSPCCCKNQWCKSTMFNVPHTLFICSAFELFCLSKNLWWWPFSVWLGIRIKYFDIKVIFGVCTAPLGLHVHTHSMYTELKLTNGHHFNLENKTYGKTKNRPIFSYYMYFDPNFTKLSEI